MRPTQEEIRATAFKLRLVGHPEGELEAHTGPTSCGGQDDLVYFRFPKDRGSWCMPFEDLETFYLMAKAVRSP